MLFDREYKGTIAPWGSVVLRKPPPKVEEGEPWKKGIFVGKDAVSNSNLVSTRDGIVKAKAIRQCTPAFGVEVLAEACGTLWDFKEQAMPTSIQVAIKEMTMTMLETMKILVKDMIGKGII